jgi:prophage regulatory protein
MTINTPSLHIIEFPATGFLRIRHLLKFVPFSRSHLWEEVKKGRFPKPIKLSDGITAWRAEDIRNWIDTRQ